MLKRRVPQGAAVPGISPRKRFGDEGSAARGAALEPVQAANGYAGRNNRRGFSGANRLAYPSTYRGARCAARGPFTYY